MLATVPVGEPPPIPAWLRFRPICTNPFRHLQAYWSTALSTYADLRRYVVTAIAACGSYDSRRRRETARRPDPVDMIQADNSGTPKAEGLRRRDSRRKSSLCSARAGQPGRRRHCPHAFREPGRRQEDSPDVCSKIVSIRAYDHAAQNAETVRPAAAGRDTSRPQQEGHARDATAKEALVAAAMARPPPRRVPRRRF